MPRYLVVCPRHACVSRYTDTLMIVLEGALSEFREISILSLCKPVPFSTPYKFAVVGSETDDRFAFWRSHPAECSCFRSVGISSL